MRTIPIWTLALVFGLCTSAWAQFGGGGFGGGLGGGFDPTMSQPGGMGGFEQPAAEAKVGITAYRAEAPKEGSFEVIWTGNDAQANRKIAEMLKKSVQKVEFVETPLTEVAAFLKQKYLLPIVIDQTALEDIGIDPDVPITISIESLTMAATLDLLTKQPDLGWYIEAGSLVITSFAEEDVRPSVRIYQLHRLEAVGAAEVIQKIVSPSSWSELGGPFDIAVIRDRNLLVIRQNRQGHDAIESLLTQLEEMK